MAVESREFAKSVEPLPSTPVEDLHLAEYWKSSSRAAKSPSAWFVG
ncbi:MAG: hypothetical protein LC796_10075 [Acidobacteria bacterium]|nr:hypothetical protein [Acidobacteriota bacterium]